MPTKRKRQPRPAHPTTDPVPDRRYPEGSAASIVCAIGGHFCRLGIECFRLAELAHAATQRGPRRRRA